MAETSFFASFPTFQHNPNAPISSEFRRLAQHRQWKQGSRNWKKNWNRCVNTEYDRILGNNVVGLDDWIELCEELGLDDEFGSIRQCKMALSKIHVNLVDVLDSRITGSEVMKFPNVNALAAYTHQTGKFFRRNVAKQDKLLRTLLRRLH